MATEPLPDDGGLLTVPEAAAALGVNHFTIRRWIKNGKLEAIRMGEKLLRIRPDAIEKFLAAGTTRGHADLKSDVANNPQEKEELTEPQAETLPLVEIEEKPGEDDLLSADEAAAMAGIKRNSLIKARSRGYITGVQWGNLWKFRREDVLAYMARPKTSGRVE